MTIVLVKVILKSGRILKSWCTAPDKEYKKEFIQTLKRKIYEEDSECIQIGRVIFQLKDVSAIFIR